MCRLKQSTNEMLVERRNGQITSRSAKRTNKSIQRACLLACVPCFVCMIHFTNERHN